MIMANNKVMSKYDYVFQTPRIIDETTETVPDLVLSMAEIYRKYHVSGGDISVLPGNIRPIVQDDGDELSDDIYDELEEMTDSLLLARSIRSAASAPAYPAAEDIPEQKEDDSSSPIPEKARENAPSTHDDNERSEEKE